MSPEGKGSKLTVNGIMEYDSLCNIFHLTYVHAVVFISKSFFSVTE